MTDPNLPEIRELYEEYELRDGAVVSMIKDPLRTNAWIQSNRAEVPRQ